MIKLKILTAEMITKFLSGKIEGVEGVRIKLPLRHTFKKNSLTSNRWLIVSPIIFFHCFFLQIFFQAKRLKKNGG